MLEYGDKLKRNELENKAAFVIQDVGLHCCGKPCPCLQYRIIEQFGCLRVGRSFDVGSEFSEFIYGNGRGNSTIILERNRMVHVGSMWFRVKER